MPAPLVHDTGIFVFAQVQAVETSTGRTLCPIRLWRWLRSWAARTLSFSSSRPGVQLRVRSRDP